jgi:hypothetical protein
MGPKGIQRAQGVQTSLVVCPVEGHPSMIPDASTP